MLKSSTNTVLTLSKYGVTNKSLQKYTTTEPPQMAVEERTRNVTNYAKCIHKKEQENSIKNRILQMFSLERMLIFKDTLFCFLKRVFLLLMKYVFSEIEYYFVSPKDVSRIRSELLDEDLIV